MARKQQLSIYMQRNLGLGPNVGLYGVRVLGVGGGSGVFTVTFTQPPQEPQVGSGPASVLYVVDPIVKKPV